MKTVLVAGASGLVGKSVMTLLKDKGFSVRTLSHSLPTDIAKERYNWSPDTGEIDIRCFDGVDHVINLSGAGVFDHWWTTSYKEKIIKSRTLSTSLLADTIVKYDYPIRTFINPSGISFYGNDTGDRWVDENSPTTQEFLARVVQLWEGSLLNHELKTRKVCLRFGIVLSDQGGALTQMATPVKYGVGSPFASGKQYISWIHIQDVTNMILFAIENNTVQGIYNAVAPDPVTNEAMIQGIADRLHKKLWAPSVPGFVMNLALGKERAAILLGGNRVKGTKMQDAGFQFQYKTLAEALHSFF
ncbi:MAG: TIGR01777 family protein [Cytophagaceae bacterium]|nr:TIGR01777 family protein [Cytophagaceae bacterium]